MKLSFIGELWERLKTSLFSSENIKKILKEKLVAGILKKYLISGGLKVWLVSYVVSELIEEGDEHMWEPMMQNFGYTKSVRKGKAFYAKKVSAKDLDDWFNTASQRRMY